MTSVSLASLEMPPRPQPLPAGPAPVHTSTLPKGSQTLASWTQMAKPLVTLVPQATQAAAVRAVPLDMKATPFNQAGSADPPTRNSCAAMSEGA